MAVMEIATPDVDPMTLGGVLQTFTGWLNRDDCTAAEASWCLNQGLIRMNRDLNIPAMEKAVEFGPYPAPTETIDIPSDASVLIRLYCDGRFYAPATLETVMRMPRRGGNPAYARDVSMLRCRPNFLSARLVYYSDFVLPTDQTQTAPVFQVARECLLYAALVVAGDLFVMPEDVQAEWEAKYAREVQALTQQGQQLDTLGSSVPVMNMGGYIL